MTDTQYLEIVVLDRISEQMRTRECIYQSLKRDAVDNITTLMKLSADLSLPEEFRDGCSWLIHELEKSLGMTFVKKSDKKICAQKDQDCWYFGKFDNWPGEEEPTDE